jgi:hypothetical protein
MKTLQQKGFIISLGLMFFLAGGCVPTMVSVSTPDIRNVENDYFSAQLEPLSQGKNYFDRFRLAVTNKTSRDLEIDWNQTRYLYNGHDGGVFVFAGIAAVDLKNATIPPGRPLQRRSAHWSSWPGGPSAERGLIPGKLHSVSFQAEKAGYCWLSGKTARRSKRK